MSSRPTDKQLRLKHILVQEAEVQDEIADWIINHTDGPQCESPADFAQLWTDGASDLGPKVDVLDRIDPPIDAATFAGRRIAGRLRTAWTFCVQDVAGEAKMRAEPAKPEDSNELQPWPDARKQSCTDAVKMLYKTVFKPEQIPASAIMNRLDRIWRDRSSDLVQLARMKTQADYELMVQGPGREKRLGVECGDAELIMHQGPGQLPPCSLDDIDQVLLAMEVMANGWVLLNTKEEQSADASRGMIRGFDTNDASSWVRFARNGQDCSPVRRKRGLHRQVPACARAPDPQGSHGLLEGASVSMGRGHQ